MIDNPRTLEDVTEQALEEEEAAMDVPLSQAGDN